jgi:hypothetical protein
VVFDFLCAARYYHDHDQVNNDGNESSEGAFYGFTHHDIALSWWSQYMD